MSALAHARGIARLMRPPVASVRPIGSSLLIGVVGLLAASRGMFSPDTGDRLFGALGLVFATAALAGFRRGHWTPRKRELCPLPVRPRVAAVVEAGIYLSLVTLLAMVPASMLALLRFQLSAVVLEQPLPPRMSLLVGLSGLAFAVAMLAPLVIAITPDDIQRGPLAMLRLLLPWLPVGIAAPAGWLESWLGMVATILAMWLITVLLLALRRTGWEHRWPTLPDLSLSITSCRTGLTHPGRLRADRRAGLARGLGLALPLTLLAWLLLSASSRGGLPEAVSVLAILTLATAFILPTWTGLSIPPAARITGWTPSTLPWALLPAPKGAFQGELFSSAALVWLVLAPVNLTALLAHYLGHRTSSPQLVVADIMLAMLLLVMPALATWEGRFINTRRPPPRLALPLFVVPAIVSFWLVISGSATLVEQLALDLGETPLDLAHALKRLLAAQGPAFLIGLAWLAAGRLLVLRDIARQRAG
jgi:hypothetical protein